MLLKNFDLNKNMNFVVNNNEFKYFEQQRSKKHFLLSLLKQRKLQNFMFNNSNKNQ